MSERLIEELRRENLCTHFILPLLKLNKFSFMGSNFVNSYLHYEPVRDIWSIVVKVTEPGFCHERVWMHACYKDTYTDGEFTYIRYYVIRKWYSDVHKFIHGKFSELSDAAKDAIRVYSKLPYRELSPSGAVITDGRLLALEKSTVLKTMWDKVLTYRSPEGMVEIPSYVTNEMELLSIPDEHSFINLDHLTRIKKPGI